MMELRRQRLLEAQRGAVPTQSLPVYPPNYSESFSFNLGLGPFSSESVRIVGRRNEGLGSVASLVASENRKRKRALLEEKEKVRAQEREGSRKEESLDFVWREFEVAAAVKGSSSSSSSFSLSSSESQSKSKGKEPVNNNDRMLQSSGSSDRIFKPPTSLRANPPSSSNLSSSSSSYAPETLADRKTTEIICSVDTTEAEKDSSQQQNSLHSTPSSSSQSTTTRPTLTKKILYSKFIKKNLDVLWHSNTPTLDKEEYKKMGKTLTDVVWNHFIHSNLKKWSDSEIIRVVKEEVQKLIYGDAKI
jgi:hypothetical protein